MFYHKTIRIGSVEILNIRNADGVGFDLIPEYGGLLSQVFLGENPAPLFDSFLDEKDIKSNTRFKQAILFPFPNRLKNGIFQQDGTKYQFPVNEPDRNNALHGFLHNKQFHIHALSLEKTMAFVTLYHQYQGDLPYFPFPFDVYLTYTVDAVSLSLTFKVVNRGVAKMPYGFGWHPYFKTDNEVLIGCESALEQEVDSRMLPTGAQYEYQFSEECTRLREPLDNAFRIADNALLAIEFGDFKGKTLRLTGDRSFRFFQIYTAAKNITAIEPVTSNINALNTGDGLSWLAPGQTATHSCGLQLLA